MKFAPSPDIEKVSIKDVSAGVFRGHIWTSKTFPAATQQAALLQIGMSTRTIYDDDIDSAIKSLRDGNRLVVDSLRGLGRDLKTIRVNLKRVHDEDAAAMDARTCRLSTGKHCKALLDEAAALLANEHRGPRKDRQKGRMPWDMIAIYWFDKRLKTEQVMAIVNNGYKTVSHTTIWRKLGERDAIVGRPSVNRIQ